MNTVEYKKQSDEELYYTILGVLNIVKGNKPNDRSEKDRRYAVVITELEKSVAYFKTFVVDEH